MVNSDVRAGDFAYDVALSFAGEQRAYVQKVAAALRRRGIRPFYDDYEKATLWGKDLYEHLDWIYQKVARTACCSLPRIISKKLGPWVRRKFFPPEPDNLFSALGAASPDERHAVGRIAVSFMQTLMRMTVNERSLVVHIFADGCRTQLPNNVHISLDIVRRDLGIAPTALVGRLRAMASIGFEEKIRSDEERGDDVLVVRWIDTITYEDDFTIDFADERATEVAVRMLDVGIGDEGCQQCAEQCIDSLDFSLLASSTTRPR